MGLLVVSPRVSLALTKGVSMKFLNKKSAFIAALLGVIFFWRKKKKSDETPTA
jgi:hypothetical protein